MRKLSDGWRTPQTLFDALNEEFTFDIDLCATSETSLVANSFCFDYLKDDYYYRGTQVTQTNISWLDIACAFMNPPYSNPKPFIEKAWEDSRFCKIVCLVPCSPSTRWWATFWEYDGECPECCGFMIGAGFVEAESILQCSLCKGVGVYSGPKPGCVVRFFPKRIKFDPPKGYDITKKYSGPAFGCALIIMDRRNLPTGI